MITLESRTGRPPEAKLVHHPNPLRGQSNVMIFCPLLELPVEAPLASHPRCESTVWCIFLGHVTVAILVSERLELLKPIFPTSALGMPKKPNVLQRSHALICEVGVFALSL